MSISLTLRTASVLPPSLIRNYRSVRAEAHYVCIYEIESTAEWEKLFAACAQEGVQIRRSTVRFSDLTPRRWVRPSADWAAAVLAPDSIQTPLNSIADYAPALPEPCRDYVAPHLPILLRTPPAGHLSAAGETYLYSEQLSQIILNTGMVSASEQEIRVARLQLEHWRTLLIHSTCRVLSPYSVHPAYPCALCGTQYHSHVGVWFADSDYSVEVPISTDVVGYGHLALTHPVILSLSMAQRIASITRGRGLVLEPVYASSSQRTRFFRHVLNSLAHYFGTQ